MYTLTYCLKIKNLKDITNILAQVFGKQLKRGRCRRAMDIYSGNGGVPAKSYVFFHGNLITTFSFITYSKKTTPQFQNYIDLRMNSIKDITK